MRLECERTRARKTADVDDGGASILVYMATPLDGALLERETMAIGARRALGADVVPASVEASMRSGEASVEFGLWAHAKPGWLRLAECGVALTPA